jgi:hypothetical protein
MRQIEVHAAGRGVFARRGLLDHRRLRVSRQGAADAGRYFYGDYCTGLLRSFVWKQGYVREHWNWKPLIDREGVLQQISSFGIDHDGELYIVELTGSIYQLVPKS